MPSHPSHRVACALACALACACGGADDDPAGPDASAATPDAPPADTCLPTATHTFALAAGAFPPSPDHPNAIVHVPDGFDRAGPIDVVVYLHGHRNCIANVLGETDTECTPGGGTRSATSLAAQLAESGRNALLVLPEVRFDEASSDPGAFGDDDGFRAFLAEALAALPPPLGPLAVDDVGHVIVASHSGGYLAVAGILTVGGVGVDEVWLFDSLYGATLAYDTWVMSDLPAFASRAKRFATFYTSGGGTLANNQAMADRAAAWVAGDPDVLVDDRTTDTWPDATYAHGLLFKRSMLSHDGVPRYYVERMLSTSALAPRTCP
jgi:hypothetical protein